MVRMITSERPRGLFRFPRFPDLQEFPDFDACAVSMMTRGAHDYVVTKPHLPIYSPSLYYPLTITVACWYNLVFSPAPLDWDLFRSPATLVEFYDQIPTRLDCPSAYPHQTATECVS